MSPAKDGAHHPPVPAWRGPLTSLQKGQSRPSGGSGPAPSGTGGLRWATPGNPRCAGRPGGRKGWAESPTAPTGSHLGPPAATQAPHTPTGQIPGHSGSRQDRCCYLGQFDGQRHLEPLHPHFHGQHVVVARGAPGAMGDTSCRGRGMCDWVKALAGLRGQKSAPVVGPEVGGGRLLAARLKCRKEGEGVGEGWGGEDDQAPPGTGNFASEGPAVLSHQSLSEDSSTQVLPLLGPGM